MSNDKRRIVLGYVVRRSYSLGGWCYLGTRTHGEGWTTEARAAWEPHQRDAGRWSKRKAKALEEALRTVYPDARAVPLVRYL